MRQAVIVSTARTPIGKAYRGAFNNTQAQELAAHAISNAVQRAGLEGGEVEDVILAPRCSRDLPAATSHGKRCCGPGFRTRCPE